MRLDDRILALAQGLTSHALAANPQLQEACDGFHGRVVRVTSTRPYLSFFVLFFEDEIEFSAEFEGNVAARLECDLMPFLKAVYAPEFLADQTLEECLAVAQEPELSAFIVKVVRAWDLWNFLQSLGSEFIPFMGGDDELALELRAFKGVVDARLDHVIQLQAQSVETAARQSVVLEAMQLELKRLRILVCGVILCLIAVTGCLFAIALA